MDPMNALASLILGIYKEKKVQTWLIFLFQLSFSAITTFLFTCGGTLIKTQNWALSIGSGMVVSSVSLAVFFRMSPLTKGMMAVLPAEEAAKELNTNIQIIEKPK